MKKTAMKEIHECDVCRKEAEYVRTCIKCGKEICFDCSNTHGKTYHHGVSVSGSGDGYYCAECDSVMTYQGTDQLHSAYRAVERLRIEAEGMWHDFERRRKDAEAKVKALRE